MSPMTDPRETDLLDRLERYYDEAPRANADVEEHGPFTIFVSRGGWPYYARPRLGVTAEITPDQVTSVLDRLEELGLPRSIEWVHDTTPSLRGAAVAAGVEVGDYPMLVLDGDPVERHSPVAVRRLAPDDPDLAAVQAAIHVGFDQDDTQLGPASVAERDARASVPDSHVDTLSAMLAAGRCVTFGAFDPALGAVGGGTHNPRGQVTEIVGVGVLPAQRRRGIGGHLTWALAADAAQAGVQTVFMSAGSDDVARIYEGVGFRRVATACIVG
jgi:ribosomal protein S18 acetylase RimI-like enzyme